MDCGLERQRNSEKTKMKDERWSSMRRWMWDAVKDDPGPGKMWDAVKDGPGNLGAKVEQNLQC